MALRERKVSLWGIILVIMFLVDVGVPYVRVWRSFCWESGEMKDAYLVEDVFIDVYTQRGGKGLGMQSDAFAPQEYVILYAEAATNTAPAPDEAVQFELRGPSNPYLNFSVVLCARTNASGIASTSFRIPWVVPHSEEVSFGIWNVVATIELEDQVICDTLTFEVGWIVEIVSMDTGTFLHEVYWIPRGNFTKGKTIDVRLTVKNIAFTPKNVWLYVSCRDKDGVPIDFAVRNLSLLGKAFEEIFFQNLYIPEFASVGTATVYTSAYDSPPSQGGGIYGPGKTAEILIIEAITDATSPSIGTVVREPEVVQPYQGVDVSASVTDSKSGVQQVILCYNLDNSSKWVNAKMNKTTGDTFVGSIPGFPAETNVSYVLIAYDYGGNFAVDNKSGQYYVFTVVPEFSTIHILLLVIIFTTAVIVKKNFRYLLV